MTNGIGKTATKVDKYADGSLRYVQYHDTKVIETLGALTYLKTGGYNTATTRRRINQAAKLYDLNVRVFQVRGELYVKSGSKTFAWKNVDKEIVIDGRTGEINYSG